MRGKKLIEDIYRRKPENCGFWIGNPSEDAKDIYFKYFGIEKEELTEIEKINAANSVLTSEKIGEADMKLAKALNSDLIWLSPELDFNTWQHPDRKPMWDVLGGEKRVSLSEEGVFAHVEDPKEIEKFDWPNPDYLDFSSTLAKVEKAAEYDLAVLGGMWCPFFHTLCDFFGMEEYFIKMYTDPDVIYAVTDHVTNFYLEANKRCLDIMGDKLTAGFFGNDLGSQRSCLVSKPLFDKFIKPFAKKIVDQMKSYGLFVTIHSCGAIQEIIPSLIEIGVDALHPLQAKAVGMEAENLVQYKDDLVFIGGVDTQELLPFGTPQQIKDKVHHLRDIFKNNFIVSPSHEALLGNVSIENVLAMSEAAID